MSSHSIGKYENAPIQFMTLCIMRFMSVLQPNKPGFSGLAAADLLLQQSGVRNVFRMGTYYMADLRPVKDQSA